MNTKFFRDKEDYMQKTSKTNFYQLLGRIFVAISLTIIVCLAGMSASCKIVPEGIVILESDYSTPKLQNIQISNSNQIYIEFDKEIKLKELKVSPISNPEASFFVELNEIENNSIFFIDCNTNFSILDNYEIFGIVEDEKYNTLTFSSILAGYNGNVPKLAISELRSYYQKPKLEYVECLALSDGNLAGMILEFYYKNDITEFVFPYVEVSKGDYIVIHGRKLDETCLDESSNLNEATFKDAVPDVLDFWIEADSKVIGNSGAILLKNRKNGDIVDALLYTEPDKTSWSSSSVEEACSKAVEAGVWSPSSSIESAALNIKPSGTRSLSRNFSKILEQTTDSELIENQNSVNSSKDMWIFVNNGNATMGKENSLVPFES